jgi:hypothetical protein
MQWELHKTTELDKSLMVNKPVVLLLVLPSWPLGYACGNAMSPCIVFQAFNLEQIVSYIYIHEKDPYLL